MKYASTLLAFLLLLSISACSNVTHIPAETNVQGVDLRPLTDEGFLVTPGDYTGGAFEAMGLVTVTVWPEANVVEGDSRTDRRWTQEDVSMQEALEKVRLSAVEMGADALTHFVVTSVTKGTAGPVVSGIQITGFAIDREEETLN